MHVSSLELELIVKHCSKLQDRRNDSRLKKMPKSHLTIGLVERIMSHLSDHVLQSVVRMDQKVLMHGSTKLHAPALSRSLTFFHKILKKALGWGCHGTHAPSMLWPMYIAWHSFVCTINASSPGKRTCIITWNKHVHKKVQLTCYIITPSSWQETICLSGVQVQGLKVHYLPRATLQGCQQLLNTACTGSRLLLQAKNPQRQAMALTNLAALTAQAEEGELSNSKFCAGQEPFAAPVLGSEVGPQLEVIKRVCSVKNFDCVD